MRRDDHRNEERCTESIRVRACAGERIITAARKRSYRERSPSQIPPPQTPLRGVEPKRATRVSETGLRMRGRALTSVPPGLPWRSLRLGCSYVAPILPAPSMCVCMRLRGHAHTAYMHEEGQSQERGTRNDVQKAFVCARARERESSHAGEGIITAARKRSHRKGDGASEDARARASVEFRPSQIPPPQTPLRGVEPKRATCVLETGLRMRGRALTSVPPGLPWRSLRLGCSYVAPISPASICMCALPLICFLLWPSLRVRVRAFCMCVCRSKFSCSGRHQ